MIMPEEIGLFDAVHTMRAMRRLKPDPVPDALIRKIIEAGLCAPSGGDVQHWRFIVVKDPEIKKQIQLRYKKALDQLLPRYRSARWGCCITAMNAFAGPPPGCLGPASRSCLSR